MSLKKFKEEMDAQCIHFVFSYGNHILLQLPPSAGS